MNKPVKFETLIFNLGEVKYDSKHSLESKCLENSHLLDYTYSSCGCGVPKLTEDSLQVEFNTLHSVGNMQPGDRKPISRYITVKLDPENPEYIRDKETGKRIENPKVRKIKFQIVGTAIG